MLEVDCHNPFRVGLSFLRSLQYQVIDSSIRGEANIDGEHEVSPAGWWPGLFPTAIGRGFFVLQVMPKAPLVMPH